MGTIETDWLAGAPIERNVGGRPAKGHTGRQRKIHCEGCAVILYGSRAALQRSGLPICGCGERMVIAHYRDRAVVERDELEAELMSYGRDAYNAAARELGWPIWGAETGGKFGHGGLGRRVCEASGCHKFSAERYCPEHEHERPEMGATHRRAA